MLTDLAAQFVSTVRSATGSSPIFYCSPDYARNRLLEEFGGCPLWIAHYGKNPLVENPSIRPWKAWHFWQYSPTATVPGVVGPCDVNLFHGSPADLAALVVR